MIERFVRYEVSCDGCEETVQRLFETKKEAEKILKDAGWQRRGKKWLCKDCQKGKSETDKD